MMRPHSPDHYSKPLPAVDTAVPCSRNGRRPQRPRETELVPIGVGEMKVAFSPFGIAGHGRGLAPGHQRALVECIDVRDVEDDAAPPGPALLIRSRNQVEIAGPCLKAGK